MWPVLPVLPRLWTARFRELAGVDFKPEAMTCRVRAAKLPSPAGRLVIDRIEWATAPDRILIWQIEPPITIDRPECGGELLPDGFWFWWDGLEFYRPAERARKLGGDVIERVLHERGWGKQSELVGRGPTELDLCRKWLGEIPLGHSAIVEFDGDTWGICRVDIDKARHGHPMDQVEIYQTTMTQHWGDEALHVSFSHRNFESAIRRVELKELARSWRILFTFEQVLPREVVAGIEAALDEPTDEDCIRRIKDLIPAGHGAWIVRRDNGRIIHKLLPGQVDQSTPSTKLILLEPENPSGVWLRISLLTVARNYAVVCSYLDEIDGHPWGKATTPPPVMGIHPSRHVATVVNKWPNPFDDLLMGKPIMPTIKPDPEQNRKDIIARWLSRIPSGRAAVVHDQRDGQGEWIFDPADLRYGAGQRPSLAPDRKVVLRVREGGPAMVEATLDLTLWELVEHWDMIHPCDPLPKMQETVVVPQEEMKKIAQEAMAKVESPLNPLPPACTTDAIAVYGGGPMGKMILRCGECGLSWMTGPQPRPIDVWRSATGHVDRSGVKVGS